MAEEDYQVSVSRRDLGRLGTGLLFTVFSPAAVLSRLHIADHGAVTLLTGKVEIGQGSRTVLTQIVASELRIPAARVKVIMGDTEVVPDDGGTWGSLTAPQTVPVIRKAAAEARATLARMGGQLEKPEAPIKPVSGRAIVTGALQYASDHAIPGMKHGKVLRGPGYRSKLLSLEPCAGLVRDGAFAGVVADTPEAATQLVRSVKAEWSVDPLPARDEMLVHFRERGIAPKPGEGGRYPSLIARGDVEAGLKAAVRRHGSTYTLVNLAHVPMEPRAVIAEWKNDRLTVWTGTQAPFVVRKELAGAFRIPEANVRVVGFDVGGAFGSKQRGECELEAARLAKGAAAPVKLAWTREEEFTAAYCRPAGVVDVHSGLDQEGRIRAWRHRNYNSGAAGLNPPYAFPDFSCEYYRAESPLRQGAYRSLAAVANNFARESHVTEVAALLDTDPLAYRLRILEDTRLREALERAASRFGWGKRPGAAQGLACAIEKDARLALCVEMDEVKGKVKVRRIVLALDAGAILNPDGLRNQAEGGLIMGIGGALFEELAFDGRHITNPRLSRYRVPRFSDVPEIEVILIDRPEIASAGAGEAPIILVAPAIAAALRGRVPGDLRSLPMRRG